MNSGLIPDTVLDFYEFLTTHSYSFDQPQYDFYLQQLLPYIGRIEKNLSKRNMDRLQFLRQREQAIEKKVNSDLELSRK